MPPLTSLPLHDVQFPTLRKKGTALLRDDLAAFMRHGCIYLYSIGEVALSGCAEGSRGIAYTNTHLMTITHPSVRFVYCLISTNLGQITQNLFISQYTVLLPYLRLFTVLCGIFWLHWQFSFLFYSYFFQLANLHTGKEKEPVSYLLTDSLGVPGLRRDRAYRLHSICSMLSFEPDSTVPLRLITSMNSASMLGSTMS